MIRYLLNKAAVVAALLSVVAIFACSKVDPRLGSNLIPGDQLLNFRTCVTDTMGYRFPIRTKYVDSFPTSTFQYNLLGSLVNPYYGRITCGFFNQVGRTPLPTDSMFGRKPVIDSAFLILAPDGLIGDMNDVRTIEMYELIKDLPYSKDSVAYSSFPIEKYIGDKPLLTFNYKGSNAKKIPFPKEYAEKFINQPASVYESDSMFRKTFKGFYFKSNDALTNGAVVSISSASAFIAINLHNSNPKPDTMEYLIDFTHFATDPVYGFTYVINQAFSTIKRDFSYATPGVGVDQSLVGTTEPQEIAYATGVAGLATVVEVPESLIAALRKEMLDKGGKAITVAKATLHMPIANASIINMNDVLKYLGLYFDYATQKLMIGYNPRYEDQSVFGGKFERSLRRYDMDVSIYIERLINGKESNRFLEVAPGYSFATDYGFTTFGNTEENPIKMTLTYSVVK